MKKLFTMLVGVLLAGSAFGQTKWTDVTINGDMESGESESFQVHEWLDEMTARIDGNARIVEDPANPANHVAVIYVRTRAEGEAAGNLTPDYTQKEGTYASWDCQFFIYAKEPIPEGKLVRLKMKVKGAKSGFFESQNHGAPGSYIDGDAFGNINYGTDWTDVTTKTITATGSKASDGTAYQSIAFNLSTTEEGNTIYFDDIHLQIKDVAEDTSDWINFMRKGIYSNDKITGVDGNGNPWQCSNFTIQTPAPEKAPVVEVPDEPGVYAVHVPVKGYKIVEELVLDSLNNPIPLFEIDEASNDTIWVVDDEGEQAYKTQKRYFWNNGEEIGTSAPARWTCQFFVSTLHKMKAGERYKFKFRAKADKQSALGTQAHYGPGQFKGWNTFGDESAFPIGPEWKEFDLGEAEGKKIPSGADGCQTITFDCCPLEGPDNNFYFIFDECSFTEANVTLADRTLGDPEELALPVNSGIEPLSTTIDLAPVLDRFEYEGSLADFMDKDKVKSGSSEGIKLFALTVPEDPEEVPQETFSVKLPWGDGGYIGANGYYVEGEDATGIQLYFDESSIEDTKISFNVWKDPDSGIEFGNHKSLKTKLAVSQSGWYYVYNIRLLSEEDYQEWIERVPGDANADKAVDVEDVVAIVNKILGAPANNFRFFNSDMNEDLVIDVEDVVAVVNLILGITGEEETENTQSAEAAKMRDILTKYGFVF